MKYIRVNVGVNIRIKAGGFTEFRVRARVNTKIGMGTGMVGVLSQ